MLPELKTGRYYHSSCAFKGKLVFVFYGLVENNDYVDSIEKLDVIHISGG
jgi:hypothetical protein